MLPVFAAFLYVCVRCNQQPFTQTFNGAVLHNLIILKHGSRAGLEFNAGLEIALNIKTLTKSLNWFSKWQDVLEKFGI